MIQQGVAKPIQTASHNQSNPIKTLSQSNCTKLLRQTREPGLFHEQIKFAKNRAKLQKQKSLDFSYLIFPNQIFKEIHTQISDCICKQQNE
jgi:hypothetical protein